MTHKRLLRALIIIFCSLNLLYGMDTTVNTVRQIEEAMLKAIQDNQIEALESILKQDKHSISCIKYFARIIKEKYTRSSAMYQLLHDYALAYRTYNRSDKLLFARLLKNGAHINTTVNGNQSLIIYVALDENENRSEEGWLEYLVEQGADVNSVDTRGVSVLAILCMKKYIPVESVKFLLQHGANPNVLMGQTNPEPLLHWAIKNYKVDLVRELLQYGADMDTPDVDGKTAFDVYFASEPRYFTDFERAYQDIELFLFIKKMFPDRNVDHIWNNIPAALDKFASEVAGGKDLTMVAPCLKNWQICGNLCCGLWTHSKIHPIEVILNSITNSSLPHRLMVYGYMEILLTPGKDGTLAPLNPWTKISGSGYCVAEHAIQLKDEQLFALCAKHKLFESYINDFIEYSIPGRKAETTTFLHLCVQHNFPAGIKMICDVCNNKLIDKADENGNTPIAYALQLGHVDCAQVLLNHRCNPGDATTMALAKTPEAADLLKNAQGITNPAYPVTIATLPHEILRHIFSYVATDSKLIQRMLSLKEPMLVARQWRDALTYLPHFSPECADASAITNKTEDIQKILYLLIQDTNRDATTNQEIFNYLIRQDINRIKCQTGSLFHNVPVCSFLHCALRTYNMDWVKTIMYWYEEYTKQAAQTDIKHIPLINQSTGFAWTSDELYSSLDKPGITHLGITLHLLKQSHNTEQTVFCLRCIEYMLEHGADPNALVPMRTSLDLSPFPLAIVALLGDVPHALPLLINHGVDVNLVYIIADRNFSHTLLSLAARDRKVKALEIILNTHGMNINTLIEGRTVLDLLHNAREIDRNNNYDAIIALVTNAGAKRAVHLAIDNNAPAALPIPNLQAPPHLVDANQHNALPHNNIAQIAHNNPDPVPGNNTQLQAVNWLGKNPLYWIAGIGTCAAGIYAWYKHRHPDEIDEEDIDDSTPLHALEEPLC